MIVVQVFKAGELQHGLAEEPGLDKYLPLGKTKTRLIERPVFSHHLVPVAVLIAESIFDGFGKLDSSLAASAQILIALEAESRRDIVRIEFQGAFEMRRGFVQLTFSLQGHGPVIQRSRVKGCQKRGIP